jgi:ABC-type glutathione transport system ATPase component
LLEVIDLGKIYMDPTTGMDRTILDGVSFRLSTGESIGIMGKSGAGKSTLARLILGLESPTRGVIRIDGKCYVGLRRKERTEIARKAQIIWQDPVVYLNPYMTALNLITEALAVLGVPRRLHTERAAELFAMVHLNSSLMRRKPHEMSGGQAQRLSIARALAMEPEILICDEALSSLDLPARTHLIALLAHLRQEIGMSLIFITHDIQPVSLLCNRMIVLDGGRIVEQGPVQAVLTRPVHPITQTMISCSIRYSRPPWQAYPVPEGKERR